METHIADREDALLEGVLDAIADIRYRMEMGVMSWKEFCWLITTASDARADIRRELDR